MNRQIVDLYQPLYASRVGSAPLVMRAVVTPNVENMGGGVPASTQKTEAYILLSALPEELRRRVELAVQALATAG